MPDDTTDLNQVDATDLRAIIGEPNPDHGDPVKSALDQHCRHFISLSPFLCLGTSGADGSHDVSPRGDPVCVKQNETHRWKNLVKIFPSHRWDF